MNRHPPQISSQGLSKSLQDGKLSDETINDIHAVLMATAEQSNSTMMESVFVQNFLPVFAGKVQDSGLLGVFINGAGGFGRRVTIVDAKGQFLFEVPPILNTSHMAAFPSNKDAPTMKQVVDMVGMVRMQSPSKADALFQQAMVTRLRDQHAPIDPRGHFQEWEAIFKRYGYDVAQPTTPFNDSNPQQPAGAATSGQPAAIPPTALDDSEVIDIF